MINKVALTAARRLIAAHNKKEQLGWPSDTLEGNFDELDMELEDFPACCGIGVVANFDSCDSTKLSKAVFLVACAEAGFGALVASTVSVQRAGITLLRHAGFTPTPSFQGMGNNRITIWQLNLKR